jgi:hypothetical protein
MDHRHFLLVLFLFLASCGDVGIALNISREQPVKIDFREEVDSVVLQIEEVVDFNIEDVDAFNEYLPKLNEIGNITFNQLAFEIDSLDNLGSQVTATRFILEVSHESDTLSLINLVDFPLTDRPKEIVPLSTDQVEKITQWLFDRKTIRTRVFFELTDFPEALEEITFDVTTFFDVTLKARNIDL